MPRSVARHRTPITSAARTCSAPWNGSCATPRQYPSPGTTGSGILRSPPSSRSSKRAKYATPVATVLWLQLGGPSAGGLTDQVVALGDVRRAPGGLDVRRGGSGQVAVELVQVAADGMPPVALAEHLAQPIGLEQPRGGSEHVADRDRAAEHGGGVLAHRVVGEGDEVVVPGEDLRPVGLLGAG